MKWLTLAACLVELPLMVLIIFVSESPLKWISVGMSWGSCIVMVTVLCIVMYAAKVKARLASRAPDCPDPLMIELPCADLTKARDAKKAEPEKPAAAPLVESEAPPPPEAVKTAGAFTWGVDDMMAPMRLHVLGWEDMPVTPRAGADPVTPRPGGDGAQTPRTPKGSGILTVTANLG